MIVRRLRAACTLLLVCVGCSSGMIFESQAMNRHLPETMQYHRLEEYLTGLLKKSSGRNDREGRFYLNVDLADLYVNHLMHFDKAARHIAEAEKLFAELKGGLAKIPVSNYISPQRSFGDFLMMELYGNIYEGKLKDKKVMTEEKTFAVKWFSKSGEDGDVKSYLSKEQQDEVREFDLAGTGRRLAALKSMLEGDVALAENDVSDGAHPAAEFRTIAGGIYRAAHPLSRYATIAAIESVALSKGAKRPELADAARRLEDIRLALADPRTDMDFSNRLNLFAALLSARLGKGDEALLFWKQFVIGAPLAEIVRQTELMHDYGLFALLNENRERFAAGHRVKRTAIVIVKTAVVAAAVILTMGAAAPAAGGTTGGGGAAAGSGGAAATTTTTTTTATTTTCSGGACATATTTTTTTTAATATTGTASGVSAAAIAGGVASGTFSAYEVYNAATSAPTVSGGSVATVLLAAYTARNLAMLALEEQKLQELGYAVDLGVANPDVARGLDRYLTPREQVFLLAALAAGFEQSGRRDDAVRILTESVEMIERYRKTIGSEWARIGFAGHHSEIYGRLVRLLIEGGRLDEAFAYGERQRARTLFELISAQKLNLGDKAAQSVYEKIVLLQSLPLDRVVVGKDDNVLNRSGHAERRKALLEAAGLDPASAPTAVGELLTPETISAQKARELAGRLGATVLAFTRTDNGFYAFRFDADGITAGPWRPEFAEIREPKDKTTARAIRVHPRGRAVSSKLEGGLFEGIKTKALIIVPCAGLFDCPMHAARLPNALLDEKHVVSYAVSLSLLARLCADRAAKKIARVAVLAGPDRPEYPELPFAVKEGKMVYNALEKTATVDLSERRDATRERFFAAAPNAGIVHLAAHGLYDEENPLKSWIALTGQAGNLYAADFFNVKLADGALVVLSGCETGRVGTLGGGEVMGFLRGLYYGGAGCVLVTLWPIDDEIAAGVMNHFYRRLSRGVPAAQALREAREKARNVNPDVNSWAGFVLYGNPEWRISDVSQN